MASQPFCGNSADLFDVGRRAALLHLFFHRSAALLRSGAGGRLGWLRGALGATIGIGTSAFLTWLALGVNQADLPWLVAPLGASSVLVFAVPASPLAQPWPVIGGNLISAAIGIGTGILAGSPMLAASLAVGLAIATMSLARCLHPPGGACALLCALGSTGADAWSWYHLWPIAVNVLTLSLVGWLYNTATGHSWPHRLDLPVPRPVPSGVATREDIEAALAEWDEVLDVGVDDLEAFYRAAVERAALRRAGRS